MERTNNLIPFSPLEIYFEEECCHYLTLTLSACNPLQTKTINRNKRFSGIESHNPFVHPYQTAQLLCFFV